METIIAWLRGINVGGNNRLPMRDLVANLQEMGLQNVQTYIQSGNVCFQTERTNLPELAHEMGAVIEKSHGFRPQVMLLRLADLETAVARNPFPEAQADHKTLHFYFLESVPPTPDLALLAALKIEREQFQLIDKVFYLYAPDGIGRSKLAEKVEKALGVATTARNWRTVSKMLEMGTAVTNNKGK
jgi:uncharacterized protein (DUF1697 family)